jgi:clan AA aspartic protease (TIGR02281 family)
MRLVAAIAIAAAVATPAPAMAQSYRWTDERGAPHYTDDPSTIPPAYRETQRIVGEPDRRRPPPVEEGDAEGAYYAAPRTATPPPVYRAPLKGEGLSYYVDADFGGGVTTPLLLDTGATITIVSPEIGRRMGFADLSRLPKMPVNTAGGVSTIYLIKIASLKVGEAVVHDVEGGISESMGERMTGLLGGSFLNEFVYQIDGPGGVLTLSPYRSAAQLYGGRDQGWWRTKYTHYVKAIRRYRELRDKIARNLTPERDPDMRLVQGMTVDDMGKIVAFYEDLFRALERRASYAGVPTAWRLYP